jgi:dipeptidyl aminopeptidase/acylaminoacyl peptidase
VFDSRPNGNSDIFVVPSAGGATRQLTKLPGEDARPAWSADGKSIYFSSDRTGENEIWRMSADGGDPAQITHHGGLAVVAAPDGQHLYYRRLDSRDGIYQIGVDGSGDTAFVPPPVFAYLTFAVTRSGIWFVALPTAAHPGWHLKMFRFADRQTVDMATLPFQPDGLGLSVSPDERYVLITKPDPAGSDLLLVNDFR